MSDAGSGRRVPGRPLPAFIGLLAALVTASPAAALPDCPSPPSKRTIASGQGRLESVIADARGRLYYTDLTAQRLLRLDGPGAEPKVLVTGINGAGGLAWNVDGSLVLGFNGSNANHAVDGEEGGLMRVDPETGAAEVITRGMGMANGVVRGPAGEIYASNNIAGNVDRVAAGRVEDDWAKVQSPNGLAIDRAGRYLFAAQTFKPASIARIDLADPTRVEPFYEATTPPDIAGGPDGATIDDADRLHVAVNAAGEVWRFEPDGSGCALARGIMNASALNWGGGPPGFPARNLYVVGFSGAIVELENATDRPPPAGPPRAERPRLRLTVAPRRAARRRAVRFRFAVASEAGPVARATVRLGNRRALTDVAGRASLAVRFFHPGLKSARASMAGFRSATVKVRILR
jgi:sugar lactone lactonase YvrE